MNEIIKELEPFLSGYGKELPNEQILLKYQSFVTEHPNHESTKSMHPLLIYHHLSIITNNNILIQPATLTNLLKRLCKYKNLEAVADFVSKNYSEKETRKVFSRLISRTTNRDYDTRSDLVQILNSYDREIEANVLNKKGGVFNFLYNVYLTCIDSDDLKSIVQLNSRFHVKALSGRDISEIKSKKLINALIFEYELDRLESDNCEVLNANIKLKLVNHAKKYLLQNNRLTKMNMNHYRYFFNYINSNCDREINTLNKNILTILNHHLKTWSDKISISLIDLDSQLRLTAAIIVLLSLVSKNFDRTKLDYQWIGYFQEGVSAHLTDINPKMNLIGQICAEKFSGVIFEKKINFEIDRADLDADEGWIYDRLMEVDVNKNGATSVAKIVKTAKHYSKSDSQNDLNMNSEINQETPISPRYKTFDMSLDTKISENNQIKKPKHLRDALNTLNTVSDDAEQIEVSINCISELIQKEPHEAKFLSEELIHRLITIENKYDIDNFRQIRLKGCVDLVKINPPVVRFLAKFLLETDLSFVNNMLVCEGLGKGIRGIASVRCGIELVEPRMGMIEENRSKNQVQSPEKREQKLGKTLKISKSFLAHSKATQKPFFKNEWAEFGPEIILQILNSIPISAQLKPEQPNHDMLLSAVLNTLAIGVSSLKNQQNVSTFLKKSVLHYCLSILAPKRKISDYLKEQSLFLLNSVLEISDVANSEVIDASDLIRVRHVLESVLNKLESKNCQYLALASVKVIESGLRGQNFIE